MNELDDERATRKLDVPRQLDQEKIDYLTRRVEELLNSNSTLRTSNSKNEKDTHDVVIYFQREIEMKDDIISRLNEELVKRETQLKFEVEKMKKVRAFAPVRVQLLVSNFDEYVIRNSTQIWLS
jgi:predicted RNase H-like nuclease (RuvC/YqgF family)